MVLFFPDNTVLINFAIIDRMDLLEALANNKGRWCMAVANECQRSARIADLEALFEAPRIFGTPLAPDAAEHQDARTWRDSMAKPGDSPLQHLGEAETLAIVTRRGLAAEAVFVTDDAAARRLASAHDIRTADTWDLFDLAERTAKVTAAEHKAYLRLLTQAGRKRPNS